MPSIARLSISPVKSMRLQHPDEVRLQPFGVLENRRFYVADPDGRMISAEDVGPLLSIRPTYDADREWLRLEFPDGLVVEGDATTTDGEVTSNFFGRPVTGRVLEGDWSGALSTFAGQPLMLVRPNPGDAVDSASVSMFSTASAEELASRSGSDRGRDARRFRMLLEVAGCRPHEEDSWIGGRVRLGREAVVEVTKRVARCVITTLDPDRGVKDFESLKSLAAYRGVVDGGINFGVYARVIEPGAIRVGDPVEPIGDREPADVERDPTP
jgi:uncharacterized protein YcbX